MNSATTHHDNTLHLRDYINVIPRHRRLMLCTIALTVTGTLCTTLNILPVYQAAATLWVQAQRVQGGWPTVDPWGDMILLHAENDRT
jgi:uncharacterized protein involved in exopolysaccharide biosynthesis